MRLDLKSGLIAFLVLVAACGEVRRVTKVSEREILEKRQDIGPPKLIFDSDSAVVDGDTVKIHLLFKTRSKVTTIVRKREHRISVYEEDRQRPRHRSSLTVDSILLLPIWLPVYFWKTRDKDLGFFEEESVYQEEPVYSPFPGEDGELIIDSNIPEIFFKLPIRKGLVVINKKSLKEKLQASGQVPIRVIINGKESAPKMLDIEYNIGNPYLAMRGETNHAIIEVHPDGCDGARTCVSVRVKNKTGMAIPLHKVKDVLYFSAEGQSMECVPRDMTNVAPWKEFPRLVAPMAYADFDMQCPVGLEFKARGVSGYYQILSQPTRFDLHPFPIEMKIVEVSVKPWPFPENPVSVPGK